MLKGSEVPATKPAEAEVVIRNKGAVTIAWGDEFNPRRITILSLNDQGLTHIRQQMCHSGKDGNSAVVCEGETNVIVDFVEFVEAVNMLRTQLQLPLLRIGD